LIEQENSYSQNEDQGFRVGTDLARLVKWEESNTWVYGIVEAQKPGWLRIYVFNKAICGEQRAVKRRENVLFT